MRTVSSFIAVLVAAALAFGSNPAIGVALARGYFQIDNSRVYGNSTVFEGSTIQTFGASSEVRLNSGARVRLGTETQGRVYRDRLVLEKNQARVGNSEGFWIEALGLRITPSTRDSEAAVALSAGKRVEVAALTGEVVVAKSDGVVVGKLERGGALEFDPQAAGAATASKITGRMVKSGATFLLRDETSGVTFELAGEGLEKYAGLRVEVTGTVDAGVKAAAGASQVMRVMSVRVLERDRAGGGARVSKAVIAGIVIAAAAGTATAIALATREKEKKSPEREGGR